MRTCLTLGVVCLLAGSLERPAFAEAATACGCPDETDLINRLNMAEAALTALQRELPMIEAADQQAGRTSLMEDRNAAGQTNQDGIRAAINGAMGNVQILGGQTSRGETGGLCGSSVEVSSTECMDEIVMFHEDNVHVPACAKDRAAGRTTALGLRAPQTTVDYVREEMAGYQAEITRIREILRTLPSSCRPSGWVGVISYFEEQAMDITINTVSTRVEGSTTSQQTTSSLKRDARILFRQAGPARGNVFLKEVSTLRETGSNRTSCKGGLATRRADRTVTGTMEQTIEISGNGEDDVNAAFDYDAQTGQISLSFEIPGLAAEGKISRSESMTGACNDADNGTKTTPDATFSQPYAKSSMSADGVAMRGLDVIRGSKTIDLAPGAAIPNGSVSHQARVSWAFYRVN